VMNYLSELRRQMNALVSNPEPERIYWASLDARGSVVTLCAAPLHIGGLLQERLFSAKECIVLVGATLSTEGTFEYLKERLGLEGPEELLLGSPFNYLGSTLVCIPNDIPEPGQEGHQEAVAQLLTEACRASRGRALALFTSHAALRAAYSAICPRLEAEGITLLGQGIDGSPAQLIAAFRGGQASVLLGAASLWEGIDVVGEALSLLVVAKLPFSVPTEPVFAARAETFDDPFHRYALPQAVLRFKQGFGRLIRSKTDRGVVVILDRRIQSRSYGQAFLNSVPACTVVSGPWRRLAPQVAAWLGGVKP